MEMPSIAQAPKRASRTSASMSLMTEIGDLVPDLVAFRRNLHDRAMNETNPKTQPRQRALMIDRTYRIAAIAGDGIGKEVLPEGFRVIDAAAKRFNIGLEIVNFEWASCDYYAAHGQMMPCVAAL
jgi:hypothetical protein